MLPSLFVTLVLLVWWRDTHDQVLLMLTFIAWLILLASIVLSATRH